MPSNGCDKLGGTALKAGIWRPIAEVGSGPGSHRSHGRGEAVK